MRVIHPNAAGIDIGADFIAVEDQVVVHFETFTDALHKIENAKGGTPISGLRLFLDKATAATQATSSTADSTGVPLDDSAGVATGVSQP